MSPVKIREHLGGQSVLRMNSIMSIHSVKKIQFNNIEHFDRLNTFHQGSVNFDAPHINLLQRQNSNDSVTNYDNLVNNSSFFGKKNDKIQPEFLDNNSITKIAGDYSLNRMTSFRLIEDSSYERNSFQKNPRPNNQLDQLEDDIKTSLDYNKNKIKSSLEQDLYLQRIESIDQNDSVLNKKRGETFAEFRLESTTSFAAKAFNYYNNEQDTDHHQAEMIQATKIYEQHVKEVYKRTKWHLETKESYFSVLINLLISEISKEYFMTTDMSIATNKLI